MSSGKKSSFWKKVRTAAVDKTRGLSQYGTSGSSGSLSASSAAATASSATASPVVSRAARAPTIHDVDFTKPELQVKGIFGTEDSPDNIQCDSGSSTIKSATLHKLVERVTHPRSTDPKIMMAFMLSYRSFTTGAELIDVLSERWRCEPAIGEPTEEFDVRIARPIRLRVANLVKAWINKYSNDFRDDPDLVKRIRVFLQEVVKPDMASTAIMFEKNLDKALEDDTSTNIHLDQKKMNQAPNPKVPAPKMGSLSLLDMHPLEIARQITLMEFKLYRRAKSWEFLGLAWTKNNGADAPNVLAMIHWSTRMSLWVATEILRGRGAKGKVKVISHFIKVARHLKELGNFNGLMEIMAGFENSAVHRLKPYWDAVPEKHMRMFEHVKEVMEPKKNYAAFRAYLKQVNPPTIPYVGMYLTDLTFMEEGSPNKTKEGLINFMKRAQIAAVISDIQQYQQTPYHLKSVMVIQDYLTHAQVLEEEAMYKISVECLPRGVKNISLKELELTGVDSADLAEQERSQEVDFGELEEVEGYVFYESDGPHNLELRDEGNESGMTLVAGSLYKLIEHLTGLKRPSLAYVETFLLTWSTFCTAEELIKLLRMRYNIPFPKKQSSAIIAKYTKAVQFPIRLRVLNLLKTWLNKYYHDLPHLGDTLVLIEAFLQEIKNDGPVMRTTVEQILPPLQRLKQGNLPQPKVDPGEPPIPLFFSGKKSQQFGFSEIPEKEMARQLTLVDQELLHSLRTGELLAYVREHSTSDKSEHYQGMLQASPDLDAKITSAIVHRGTLFYRWVHTEVLRENTVDSRASKIERFLKVTYACLQLRNYNSVGLLMSALESEELSMLQATWNLVSRSQETQEHFKELKKVSSCLRDRSQFFSSVIGVGRRFEEAAIPPLHLFLDSLQTVENSSPDVKDVAIEEDGDDSEKAYLICFEKRRKQAEILADVIATQQRAFSLKPVEQVLEMLNNLRESLWDFAAIATRVTELQEEEEHFDLSALQSEDDSEDRSRSGSQLSGIESIKAGVGEVLQDADVIECLRDVLFKPNELRATIMNDLLETAAGPVDFADRVEEAIQHRFPDGQSSEWSSDDTEGVILGWPSSPTIRLIEHESQRYAVFSKPFVNRATLSSIFRTLKFYEDVEQAESPSLQTLIVASSVENRSQAVAEENSIEILLTARPL
eukprot:CAMPEP_0174230078 /NCGR_PEP_ID=MMETSP0417-20130205/904_1 /TAXON_ID=242541 /ORGANISM="Mayorella sp, Strain BSH-02190019" /LENGTH=1169 /DNA_ID=CAMNT_0015307707 /DNA_START=62 /DNA_END=3571 /DNA_ORIENTATION=+